MLQVHELMDQSTEHEYKESDLISLKSSEIFSEHISDQTESNPENKLIKLPNTDNVFNKKDVDVKNKNIK